MSLRHQAVGGSGGKAGFADPVASGEQQRADGRVSEGPCSAQGGVVAGVRFRANAGTTGNQRLEGYLLKHAEVAVALQPRETVGLALLYLAEAGEGTTEIRVTNRQVAAHPALTAAGWAGVSASGLSVELLHPLRSGDGVREVPLL